MWENAGKRKCAGAETGNPEQKIGGHDTGRSAESSVNPEKGEVQKDR